ncbi:hypothetical protein CEQ21_01845 [Niallia circulans]|uniref:Uncharacterized protein n=1 Tax=Niallia circulans TaxID=1397 RepID=A0A553SRW7_NIACI|nr:hypothetical protein [Niallia circulans]TRZ39711.1 hypothetical protein CEQ21_01845 [Niallia circulans]
MKIVKEAGIISLVIVIFNLVISFITRPIYFINQFKAKFWFEFTTYLFALTSIFLLIYVLLVIKKSLMIKKG